MGKVLEGMDNRRKQLSRTRKGKKEKTKKDQKTRR